jgi:hypothetical protein
LGSIWRWIFPDVIAIWFRFGRSGQVELGEALRKYLCKWTVQKFHEKLDVYNKENWPQVLSTQVEKPTKMIQEMTQKTADNKKKKNENENEARTPISNTLAIAVPPIYIDRGMRWVGTVYVSDIVGSLNAQRLSTR